MPDAEIGKIVSEIAEIKLLLFCRQLLSHSMLLPVALQAKSVDEFLANPTLADADLRDLCLKVEQPSLQMLRDACADLVRGDEVDDDEEEEIEQEEQQSAAEVYRHNLRYGHLESLDPGASLFYDFLSPEARLMYESADFEAQCKPDYGNRKMKVMICGKSIWNYTSQQTLARDGMYFQTL